MIARLQGTLVEKRQFALILNVGGIHYEVMVPLSILNRVDGQISADGSVTLITYHYLQMTPSSANPVLIGFLNEVEKDFFLDFISVSGIGPRAAVRALNKPISEIARAIEAGDIAYLKTLPGIGLQRAKEIVAKLQNKASRFALIQDKDLSPQQTIPANSYEQEALAVLLQLQYKRNEAMDMIQKAKERTGSIRTTEELLNDIYKQRINA